MHVMYIVSRNCCGQGFPLYGCHAYNHGSLCGASCAPCKGAGSISQDKHILLKHARNMGCS